MTHISRSELLQADALVNLGHIMLFDGGNTWGSAQVYEARGWLLALAGLRAWARRRS